MNTFEGYTARREYDTVNPLSMEFHQGKWVVRQATGEWVDADRYRYDLLARYPGLEIIGD